MLDSLKQLNFTDNEIKLYVWLLGNGEHTAAEVARNLTMDKSSAYRAAENLTQYGILYRSDHLRGTTYEALNPDVLKDIYNQKKTQIVSLEATIDNLIKNLQINSTDKKNTLIKIEHNYNAHIRYMELSLEDNPDRLIQEFWNLDSPIFSLSRYSRYLKEFIKRQLENKIKSKYLINFNPSHKYTLLNELSNISGNEIRIVSKEFANISTFRLFSNYTEILTFDEVNGFTVIMIKNPIVTSLFQDILKFIWEHSNVYTINS